MIGTLTWDIRAADQTLVVLTGTMSIDDQNIPAATADLVVPYDAAVLAVLDPRSTNVPRVVLTGRISDWASRPVSTMSAYLVAAGGTVADATALWTGYEARDVSALFGGRLHEMSLDAPRTMSISLHVREINHDEGANTMTVSLASDEALLTDWVCVSTYDVNKLIDAGDGAPANWASSYVNMPLTVVLGRPADENVYTSTTLSADFEFSILDIAKGPTAWEMVRAALDDADLSLRLNPSGIGFSLQRPENSINNTGTHAWLFTQDEVISAKQVYSRSGEWYDSAFLMRDGVPTAGYPITGPHSRTYREDWRDGTKPTTSMATSIVRRSRNRGRFIDIVAPIRFLETGGMFMRDEFTYEDAEGVLHPWITKSVNYDFSAGTMSFRGEQRY